MKQELWIIHCLQTTTGRSLIALSDNRKQANRLRDKMCIKLAWDSEDFSPDDFCCTTKKVKELNEVILDLT